MTFFPPVSAVEGMESVPSVCGCLSVSALTAEPFDVDTKFGGGYDLDNISDECEGQGHRSKVKVTRLKSVISKVSDGLSLS